MSVCDITTGDFFSTQIKQSNNFAKLLDEISRYSPAEIVVNEMMYASCEEISKIRERFECYISRLEDTKFEEEYKQLSELYNIYCEGKKVEDIEEKVLSIISSNGLLNSLWASATPLEHRSQPILFGRQCAQPKTLISFTFLK